MSKRVLDVAVAGVLLVLSLPLFLLVAVVVGLTSRGPVFFVHERVGLHGVPFRMIKFRTLRPGTDDELRANAHHFTANEFKVRPDDHRITRVGALLRKSSLDELPQLLHVISGRMSLVGIRPIVQEQLMTRPVAYQEMYCSVRPGLTGLWQINGRSTRLPGDRLQLDEEWHRTWSFWGDVKILLRTPAAVLRLHHAH